MKAHPLVAAEWAHILDVPAYDFQIANSQAHLGVYVRRVSGDRWHTLAGLVNHVVVSPESRGEGYGRGAILSALRWLTDAGVPFALLHSDKSAVGFYDRLGFVPAPNFPSPSHRAPRVSMVAELLDRPWPDGDVRYVEPW